MVDLRCIDFKSLAQAIVWSLVIIVGLVWLGDGLSRLGGWLK